MGETTLERAERQFQQAKARLSAAKAREASVERKRDTRRKVILGGALIDLAERDDRALAMLNRLIDNLPRDRDKESFDGWERPRIGETASENGNPAGSGNGMHRPAPVNGDDADKQAHDPA